MQKILAMGLICFASSAAFAAQTTGWYGIGGNSGHTGYLQTKSDASKFKILWSKQFSDPNASHSDALTMDMSVTDDRAFISISRQQKNNDYPYQGMFGLNAKTGEQIWHEPIPANMSLVSAPAVDGGWLYYNMNDSRVTKNGKYHGMVAAQEYDGSVVVSKNLDFDSGIASLAPPMVFNGFLFTKDFSNVTEYDTVSGNKVATYNLPHNDSQLVIGNGFFISTLYSDFNVYDYWAKKPSYTISTPGQTADSAYANVIFDTQHQKTAYAVFYNLETDSTGILYAFDIDSHEIIWSYPLNNMAHQPAIADGVVYVVSDQTLQAIDADTGKLQWRWTIDKPVDAEMYHEFAPVITNNHVFISGAGYTFAINRKTHQKEWELNQSGNLKLNHDELFVMNDYRHPGLVTAISLS